MRWVDPHERTLDQLWDAADKACQWRSPYLSFVGIHANVTGKGGWNALVWGGDNPFPSFPDAAAWGRSPRLALGDLIVRLESAPPIRREPLWFEPKETTQ